MVTNECYRAGMVRRGAKEWRRSLPFLYQANRRYAAGFEDPGMDARPVLEVAVVACMDARLDLHAALGLELGVGPPPLQAGPPLGGAPLLGGGGVDALPVGVPHHLVDVLGRPRRDRSSGLQPV